MRENGSMSAPWMGPLNAVTAFYESAAVLQVDAADLQRVGLDIPAPNLGSHRFFATLSALARFSAHAATELTRFRHQFSLDELEAVTRACVEAHVRCAGWLQEVARISRATSLGDSDDAKSRLASFVSTLAAIAEEARLASLDALTGVESSIQVIRSRADARPDIVIRKSDGRKNNVSISFCGRTVEAVGTVADALRNFSEQIRAEVDVRAIRGHQRARFQRPANAKQRRTQKKEPAVTGVNECLKKLGIRYQAVPVNGDKCRNKNYAWYTAPLLLGRVRDESRSQRVVESIDKDSLFSDSTTTTL